MMSAAVKSSAQAKFHVLEACIAQSWDKRIAVILQVDDRGDLYSEVDNIEGRQIKRVVLYAES